MAGIQSDPNDIHIKHEPNAADSTTNGLEREAKEMRKYFYRRVRHLYAQWRKGSPQNRPWMGIEGTKEVDALLIMYGKLDEEVTYNRTRAVALRLFGRELEDAVLLFVNEAVHVITTKKKGEDLHGLVDAEDPNEKKPGYNGPLRFEVHTVGKKDDMTQMGQKVATWIAHSHDGKRIGILGKLVPNNTELHTALIKAVANDVKQFEQYDVGTGYALWLVEKDMREINITKKAADLTTRVFRRRAVPAIEDIIDQSQERSHSSIADDFETMLKLPQHPELNAKDPQLDIDADECDSCYTPIVQSGFGSFDLRPSAQSDDKNLNTNEGVIILQMGASYRGYCTNIGRTLFINPNEEQRRMYTLLTDVYTAVRSAMKEGAKANNVYAAAINVIKARRKDLVANFVKDVGFGIGLEFREALFLLNEKSVRTLHRNQTFNLAVGFKDLETTIKDKDTGAETKQQYALLIADTVMVGTERAEPLTHAPRDLKEVAYFVGDEDDEEQVDDKTGISHAMSGRRTRDASKQDESDEVARRAHQAELVRKQREIALQKLAAQNMNDFGNALASTDTIVKPSYPSIEKFPPNIKPNTLQLDIQAFTVLLPISDQLVPFHISTFRQPHKSENNGFSYLRLGFNTPDAAGSKSLDPKIKAIRELTFRGPVNGNLDKMYFEINELRKRWRNRLKEIEAVKDIVIQEDLKLNKTGPVPTLKDIGVRPQLSRKKNMTGTLTAHLNGFRFVTVDKVKVDVIYSNIKQAFYQPAENTTAVLLHLQLHSSIILDKAGTNKMSKKTDYLQFFVEVVEASEDIGMMNRYRDDEGIYEEQKERLLRRRWNDKFLQFVRQVEDQVQKSNHSVQLEFDIPYTELSFTGVPAKQQVTLLPTVHSLVALDDHPPLVIALNEIEICNFERVAFSLREFDIVFVWKNFDRDPIRIDSVPMKYLSSIKQWLNSCDIVYYESNHNLIWKNVMKHIKDDLHDFWENGGWEFLNFDHHHDDSNTDNDDDDDSNNDLESEFEPSSSNTSNASSEEYESESEYDDEDEDDDDAEESASSNDDEDANPDWDELEHQAEASDQRKAAKRAAIEGRRAAGATATATAGGRGGGRGGGGRGV